MKKCMFNYMAVIMVAVMSVGFVSCGDDNEDYVPDEYYEFLQGTWKFQKGTENIMGMTIEMDRSMLSQIKEQMEQATGTAVEFWDETLSVSGSTVNGVEFQMKGNRIILDGIDTDDITIQIKSISSATLVLRESINVEGLQLTADIEYRKY